MTTPSAQVMQSCDPQSCAVAAAQRNWATTPSVQVAESCGGDGLLLRHRPRCGAAGQ